tara:strand:- start:98 stop:436 length:339 start_codon:yes stop_codon:yes gene_type:complete
MIDRFRSAKPVFATAILALILVRNSTSDAFNTEDTRRMDRLNALSLHLAEERGIRRAEAPAFARERGPPNPTPVAGRPHDGGAGSAPQRSLSRKTQARCPMPEYAAGASMSM